MLLKRVFLGGLGTLAVLFLAGLTFSGEWTAGSTISIAAPPELIYEDVATLRKWREWSIWNDQADPDCQHTYEGPESGVGAKWKWNGPVLSEGVLTITEASIAKGVKYDLELAGMAPAKGALEFELQDKQTTVSMTVRGSFGGAFGGWLALLMPIVMEGEFAKCLTSLKGRAEPRVKSPPADASFQKKK